MGQRAGGNTQARGQRSTIRVIAADEDASREKRPLHAIAGNVCIRGIILINERTGRGKFLSNRVICDLSPFTNPDSKAESVLWGQVKIPLRLEGDL